MMDWFKCLYGKAYLSRKRCDRATQASVDFSCVTFSLPFSPRTFCAVPFEIYMPYLSVSIKCSSSNSMMASSLMPMTKCCAFSTRNVIEYSRIQSTRFCSLALIASDPATFILIFKLAHPPTRWMYVVGKINLYKCGKKSRPRIRRKCMLGRSYTERWCRKNGETTPPKRTQASEKIAAQ